MYTVRRVQNGIAVAVLFLRLFFGRANTATKTLLCNLEFHNEQIAGYVGTTAMQCTVLVNMTVGRSPGGGYPVGFI